MPDFLKNESVEIQQYLTPLFYSELLSSFLAFFTFSYCEEAIESSDYLKNVCSVQVGEKTRAAARGEEFCPVGVVLKEIEEVDFGKIVSDYDIKVS